MRIFKINYARLVSWLLPVKLRRPRLYAFLRSVTTPIVWLYGRFHVQRKENLYKLDHRQHVTHLEAVLNDKWDNGFRRIKVVDAPIDYQPTMIYKTVENKAVYIFQTSENQPELLWTNEEVLFGGIDFVVQVPVSIPYNLEEMRSTVRYYKTPGMGFIIQDV